jgi:aquaporin Z
MIKPLIEFIGTFIFFMVILQYGHAIPIAIALAAVIYFGGSISGGHFNPGVSLMTFLNGGMSAVEMALYVLMQCLAAVAAVYLHRYLGSPVAVTSA